MKVSTNGGSTWDSITTYKYDPDGNRVSKTVSPVGITTNYLIDSYNHTGYSQTFVEKKGADRISYIIGDDVLAQAKYIDSTTTHTVDYLLYDGHGSTRQLSDNSSPGVLIPNES